MLESAPKKVKIVLEGYKCLRCGYQWIPRKKDEVPEICPKCKSASWHKAKKN